MKQGLFISLLFLISTTVFAQRITYKGYVVRNNGDTMKGNIKMDFNTDLNYHVVNLIDNKGFVTKYNVWEIKMYSLNNEYFYRKQAERGVIHHRDNMVLMQLIKDGKIKLYAYEYTKTIGGSGKVEDGLNSGGEKDYYYENKGEALKLLTKLNYKSRLKELLKDKPEIVAVIDAKEFEYSEIPTLIAKFNK